MRVIIYSEEPCDVLEVIDIPHSFEKDDYFCKFSDLPNNYSRAIHKIICLMYDLDTDQECHETLEQIVKIVLRLRGYGNWANYEVFLSDFFIWCYEITAISEPFELPALDDAMCRLLVKKPFKIMEPCEVDFHSIETYEACERVEDRARSILEESSYV